jgi:hypothetical protein
MRHVRSRLADQMRGWLMSSAVYISVTNPRTALVDMVFLIISVSLAQLEASTNDALQRHCCDVIPSSAISGHASHSGSRRRKLWTVWAVVCMRECILWSFRGIRGRRDFSTSRLLFGGSGFGDHSRPSPLLFSFLEVSSLSP